MNKPPLTLRPARKAFQAHNRDIRGRPSLPLFDDDSTRGERLTADAVDVYLDHSTIRVTDETLMRLVELAEQSGLCGRIDAMFRREKITITESRARQCGSARR